MEIDNSNKSNGFESRDSSFYISKIQPLQKRIQNIVCQLRIPMNYILPSDFEEKYEEAKQSEQIDNYWVENYKEIVAFIIEGKINTTLAGLSVKFSHQFGGQTLFWMDLICNFAQNQKYDENLRIWQVNDIYKNCLNLQKGQYENNRKFKRLAKTDIQTSKALLTSISQLKNSVENQTGSKKNHEQILAKTQANYKKHEQSNKKLVQFLKNHAPKNLNGNLQFFHATQPIFKQKIKINEASNSRSKRMSKQSDPYKQKMITDFSNQITDNKNAQLLRKIGGPDPNILSAQKMSELENFLSNMNMNQKCLNSLRSQFQSSKSKLFRKHLPYYTTIIQEGTYFSLNNFLISAQKCSQFSLGNPFEAKTFINYENNDIEEYQQLVGDDLNASEEWDQDQTQQDSLESDEQRALIQYGDAFQMDDEDKQIQQKAIRKNREFQGKEWVFDLRKQPQLQIIKENDSRQNAVDLTTLQNFMRQLSIICPMPIPMPLSLQDKNEFDESQMKKMRQIVQGRSMAEINLVIESDFNLRNMFSSQKIKYFLGKYTRKSKNKLTDKRFVYIYTLIDPQSGINQQAKSQNAHNMQNVDNKIDLISESGTYLDESKSYTQKMQIEPNYFTNHQQKIPINQSNISQLKSLRLSNQDPSQEASRTNRNSSQRRSQINLTQTLSNTTSFRLRQRKQRPNYNLNQIFRKSQKKKVSSQEDIQI